MIADTNHDVDEPLRAAATRGRRAIMSPRLVDVLISALLVAASLVLAIVQVPQHSTVSPIDEYVYIDYLDKVPTQLVVHRGEQTGQYARLYLSCHGVRSIGFYPDSFCKNWQPADADRMPNEGLTTADIYTPLYFGATWLMAQPLQWLGVDDITQAGRYTGWVWLGTAAVLLYLALRRMRISPLPAGSVALLMVGSLPAYWSNTYISTDATALLAGSAMLFGITLFRNAWRHALWVFVLLAAIVTLAKLQNLLAVVAAALYLLMVAFADTRSAPSGTRMRSYVKDRRVLAAAAAVILSVGVQAVWVVVRSAIAVGPSPDQGVAVPLGRRALVSEMFKFFPGVANGALDPDQLGFPAPIVATMLTWVIVAGVLGLLAASRDASEERSLALSTFVVSVFAGPALAVATTVVTGYYFALPLRYGMPLLPFMLACGAMLCARSVWTKWLLAVLAVASYYSILTLVG